MMSTLHLRLGAMIGRRWLSLVTAVFALLYIRLMLQLASHFRGGTVSRRISSAGRMVSDQLRSSNDEPDANLTAFDLQVDYPLYLPSLPRFVDMSDRRTFAADGENRAQFVLTPSYTAQFIGRVRVLSNAVVRLEHECSWKTSEVEFRRRDGEEASLTYANKTLCPLLVPDGRTFQHFVDGVLPKLVQLLTAAPRVASTVDLFVLQRPRDAVVYELLDRVGVGRDRLLFVTPESWPPSRTIDARFLVDTCRTPSLHPRLLTRASHLLRACEHRNKCDYTRRRAERPTCCRHADLEQTDVPDGEPAASTRRRVPSDVDGATTANRSLVVLLSRRWSRNGGRRLLNENAVVEYLVGRYGHQRVVRFGDGLVNFATASDVFSRAVVVVGVHGGAFYNVILAPAGCVVVELMPLVITDHGRPPRRLAHTIVWRLADALGHTYWRLYAETSSQRGDVTLSVDKLRLALRSVTVPT